MLSPLPQVTDDDVDTAARTIYGEARGEADVGKLAVAHVINNRRVDIKRRWPDTIKGVCLQPLQFSCWNKNDPNREKILALNPKLDEMITLRRLMWAALSGEYGDPTQGCNHYLVSTIANQVSWAKDKVPIITIGHHSFYRL